EYFNPLHVLAPAWGPRDAIELAEAGRRLLLEALCWGGVAAVCLGVAVWRLRPAYVRELESVRPGGRRRRGGAGRGAAPEEPVHWRERHVEGLAPNPTLRRVPQWLGITLIAALTVLSSLAILWASLAPGKGAADVLRAVVQLRPDKVRALLPDAGDGFLVQS